MNKLTIISVGKLKDEGLRKIENDYLKRINSFKIEVIESKAYSEDKDKEAKKVLEIIRSKENSPTIILLSERGQEFDSAGFAQFLNKKQGHVFLVFGGAAGHGEEIIKAAHGELSLSKLTFAHQLARIVLMEQLYRAHTLLTGHPYHK